MTSDHRNDLKGGGDCTGAIEECRYGVIDGRKDGTDGGMVGGKDGTDGECLAGGSTRAMQADMRKDRRRTAYGTKCR